MKLHELITDDGILIEARFRDVSPLRLLDHWIEPELLALWWPQQAIVDPEPGGRYHLSWPVMNWTMRGQVRELERGARLSFTWAWDHEPDLPPRRVTIEVERTASGSGLTLTQGPYAATEREIQDRQSHVDGWAHFFSRLAPIVEG
ncbi:MAG: SRPBCC domain-containing protein [bacterium]